VTEKKDREKKVSRLHQKNKKEQTNQRAATGSTTKKTNTKEHDSHLFKHLLRLWTFVLIWMKL